MRCKHLNFSYREMTPHYKIHHIQNGEIIDSAELAEDDISRIVSIKCYDCGLKKEYDTYSKNCPKWVKNVGSKIIDKLLDDITP